MTMDRSSRTAGTEGDGKRPRVAGVPGAQAPVESPMVPAPGKHGTNGNGNGHSNGYGAVTSTAPLRADDRRSSPMPQSPETEIPPAPKVRTRSAPFLFILTEMLLDMVAIASAFGLAYWLRFESDIFRRCVAPDQETY